MKLTTLLYSAAFAAYSYIAYAARALLVIRPDGPVIDVNIIAFGSIAAAILTALGAITSLVVQNRAATVKDLQDIITHLSRQAKESDDRIEKLEMEKNRLVDDKVKLEIENIALRDSSNKKSVRKRKNVK